MARKNLPTQKDEEMEDDTFVNDEPDDVDDQEDDSPPTIDPYHVLGLETEATAEDVKKAYRKLALKHHPDKAADGEQEAAKKKFQEVAFAYAVLSDSRRRNRYDLTGSTAESLEDDADFDWLSFYREQFEHVVNEEAINKVSDEFKGSDEERKELLKAYKKAKGNLNAIYELVMLSDILIDDERFRQILDEAIANGTVEAYPAYAKEDDESRKRAKDAERKRREDFDKRQAAEEKAGKTTAKANGKAKSKKKQAGDDMAGLAALIQQRQKQRAGGFFDQLEAKYAPKSRGSKRSTPMDVDEPSEEAFQAMADRAKKQKRSGKAKKVQDEDEDEEIDVGEEDIRESDEETDEEEEAPRKTKAKKSRAKSKGRARGSTKA